MTQWSSGYVADIGYTYGYYQELNPQRIKLAFLYAGLVPPDVAVACEIGFGQGISVNIHGASSDCVWFGNDFNPAQASFAKSLSAAARSKTQLFDDSFQEFAKRDLPDFDYIALHGIWSWVSDENRAVIVDFVRRKLKVGGVLYVSYNTLPGWEGFLALRHLMTQHVDLQSPRGMGIEGAIGEAIKFTDSLLATSPIVGRAHPGLMELIEKMKSQPVAYLAHEYFNRDWSPMHFAEVAKWLDPAKLTYACSAHFPDHLREINFSSEQNALLDEQQDTKLKQTTRDFLLNQRFRKDYWVKGQLQISTLKRAEELRKLRFVLTDHLPDFKFTIQGARGEAGLVDRVYAPVFRVMSDYRVRSLKEIEQALCDEAIEFEEFAQAVFVLCAKGTFTMVQAEKSIADARETVEALNLKLIELAGTNNDFRYLASPVTGGGFALARFSQLFVLAIKQGLDNPSEWAQFVLRILKSQEQKIVKDGKALESDGDQLSELVNQASEFEVKQLPILKALQIV